jgi:hypothetical protein
VKYRFPQNMTVGMLPVLPLSSSNIQFQFTDLSTVALAEVEALAKADW